MDCFLIDALDTGAGDRLGLQCDVTGESVPTAMLPYCGRSLLSGIIRDLQVMDFSLLYPLTGFLVQIGNFSFVVHSFLGGSPQAREYLYYKVFGSQETTPIAIMTSAAKGNHQRVQKLLADSNWFGRGKESFRHVLVSPSALPSGMIRFLALTLN